MAFYGFHFDAKKCIGCHACEAACEALNSGKQTVKWRSVRSISRGRYPNIQSVNVSITCMQCLDAPCIKSCPRQAMSRNPQTGGITIDEQTCMGCAFCLWVCPFGAPQLGLRGKMEKCDYCQDRPPGMKKACEEVCPTKAIHSGARNGLGASGREEASRKLLHQLSNES